MRILYFAIVLSSTSFAVAQAAAAPTTRPGSTEDPARLAYFHRTLIDAYETVGSRNPAWDADARTVLKFAVDHWMAPSADPDVDWQILIAGNRAIEHGCDDPAVLYSVFRAHLALGASFPGKVMSRLDNALLKSQYAPYITLFSLVHLVEYNKNRKAQEELLKRIYAVIPAVLADKGFPQDRTAKICSDLTFTGKELDGDRKPMIDKLHDTMAKAAPDSAIPDLFLGMAYWHYSWDARGVGAPALAGSPRDERHRIGREALEAALRKDPHSAAAAATMVGTLVDSGATLERTDEYFRLAIANDPDYLEAYRYEMGSMNVGGASGNATVLNFGRMCLAGKRYRSHIPYMLLRAHRSVSGADGDPEFYRLNPLEWHDVEVLYEGFFTYNTKAISERIHYANLALMAGHVDIAKEQLEDLKSLTGDPTLKIIFNNWNKGLAQRIKKAEAKPPTK